MNYSCLNSFFILYILDFSVFNPQQAEEEMDSKSIDELEQSLLLLSETKTYALSNKSLWRKQVFTMAKLHLLSLKRDRKSLTEM